jgi:hypothetical protein
MKVKRCLKFTNNKRLFKKDIDNNFRIILPLKMAEIIEFKK